MTTSIDVSTERVFEVLMNVKDPEIDSVSIIDLGMVEEVTTEGNNVKIVLLPTFLGCPALEIIKKNTMNAVKKLPEVEECRSRIRLSSAVDVRSYYRTRACESAEVWNCPTAPSF